MGFQKKAVPADTGHTAPSQSAAPKGLVDSKRYAGPLALLANAKKQLTEIELGLEASVKTIESTEEDRRREGDTYAFDLKLARDKQLADFAKEDAERASTNAARESALTIAEGDFAELLGVTPVVGDHLATGRALRTGLEAKLKEQFETGKKEGATGAKASYEIAKQIDAANAKTELSLLTQKNTQLEASVVELKLQNQKLFDAQTKTNETVADVAKQGLNAAAGVVNQGNNALGAAATGFPGGSTRAGR